MAKEKNNSRFSGMAFVPEDYGAEEEQAWRAAVAAAFDAADEGDYGPGITLGIFPEPDEEEV